MYLPMAGLVDKEKERARLEKQAGKLTKDMEVLENRLSGSNFVEKVQHTRMIYLCVCVLAYMQPPYGIYIYINKRMTT